MKSRLINIISMVAILTLANVMSAADSQRILCFGDSITAAGKWVTLVGEGEGIKTINAGKSGRRAAQAKEALAVYLDEYSNLDKIIMLLGVNDLPARDKRPGTVKVAACVINMNDAIDLALTRFKPEDVILMAPCNVNPETMTTKNLTKGYQVTPPLLAKMESDYKALAKEKGILFLSLLKVVSPKNITDGVHPNEAGHVEIAAAISGFLSSKPQ